MASSLRGLLALSALFALPLSSAQHQQFYRWSVPEIKEGDLARRQNPPPGYHPEFGTCGSGTTCENACGEHWLSCEASTDLSLFCYNKVQLNQTCCGNKSGRACDNGFYCAWNTFGGKVWCCKNGQSLEECGVDIISSSSDSSSSTEPPDGKTKTITETTTTTTTVGTDGTYTTTTTETLAGATVTTTSTTTVGAATVTTTTTQTVGTATSTTTVTEPGGTETVSVTIYTDVPSGVSTITAYSTISVTITTGCPTSSCSKDHPGYPTSCSKDHPGYPTTKHGGGYPEAPTGKHTDKDGEHYIGGEPPHTVPYGHSVLLVNNTAPPSTVVTGAAGRMAVGGLAVWILGAVLVL
ncbi:hypothetical protein B0T16DRAFT_449236 [Cercophora newfieldiana]|uniref:Uncharacterized protein n=1 Tax=Cercophora newfieldiana TaxID=92897 RepID=A0AA39XY43_9PEZI|nr:hypothetical protein B0T16DRAFT_449236 [Cercophora newfieldiana]